MARKSPGNVDWMWLLRSPAFALVAFTVVVVLVALAYEALSVLRAAG